MLKMSQPTNQTKSTYEEVLQHITNVILIYKKNNPTEVYVSLKIPDDISQDINQDNVNDLENKLGNDVFHISIVKKLSEIHANVYFSK